SVRGRSGEARWHRQPWVFLTNKHRPSANRTTTQPEKEQGRPFISKSPPQHRTAQGSEPQRARRQVTAPLFLGRFSTSPRHAFGRDHLKWSDLDVAFPPVGGVDETGHSHVCTEE